MSKPKKFGPWELSSSEETRLANYQRLRDLATKDAEKHDQLYQRDKSELEAAALQSGKLGSKCLPQLYVNLPNLVARTAADLVLSQPAIITGESDEITTRIDRLRERSKLDAAIWRAVFWTSILGDSYFTIADKTENQKPVPIIKLRRALNTVARNIRPEDSDATRELLCQSMIGDIQLFTRYATKLVEFTAFKKDEKGEWQTVTPPAPYQQALDTKETTPLFVPISALRGDDSDENFGESDIQDTTELSFEIANRLRQTQRILDKHADPAANVPEGALDDKGLLNIRDKKVFERDASGAGLEYVVWQSQLSEGYNEIDRLLHLIALITETPSDMWGLNKGGEAESGRALKFRLLTGLGKARRTGMMLRDSVSAAIRLALRREDILANKPAGEYLIKVQLADTFIADEQETAENVVKLRGANAMSIKEAVRLGQGKTGDDLDKEVQAIEAEQPEEIGFEAERKLGQPPIESTEAPEVEPIDINGAAVDGLIKLVKVKFLTVPQALARLKVTDATPERIQEIEAAINAAAEEGPAA